MQQFSYHNISLFNCLIPIKQTKKTDAIFKKLYDEIVDGVSYIEELKSDKFMKKFVLLWQ